MDTYTSSKGETMLITSMENPHLIHSIAKLAAAIEAGSTALAIDDAKELLKSLKNEAISRMAPRNVEPAQDF